MGCAGFRFRLVGLFVFVLLAGAALARGAQLVSDVVSGEAHIDPDAGPRITGVQGPLPVMFGQVTTLSGGVTDPVSTATAGFHVDDGIGAMGFDIVASSNWNRKTLLGTDELEAVGSGTLVLDVLSAESHTITLENFQGLIADIQIIGPDGEIELNTLTTQQGYQFTWSPTPATYTINWLVQAEPGANMASRTTTMSFQMDGPITVPEPGAVGVVACGMLVGLRRRK